MSETKRFKKGEKVAYVQSWDGQGTFRIRRATVHSCGAKVLRLIDAATGETFKIGFRAYSAPVVRDASDAELEAVALERAAAFLAEMRAIYAERLANPAFNPDAVRKSLNELHEPRAIWQVDAMAEVEARLQESARRTR